MIALCYRFAPVEFILNNWLRRKNRPENDPIEELVRLELKRSREFLPAFADIDQTTLKIVELINSTAQKWNPGQRRSASQVGHNDWKVVWQNVGWSEEPEGMLVLDKCLLLKEEGLLDRIRQCAKPGCGEWFFAKFDHQIAHADACRIAMLSADETRKEMRRQYMPMG